MSRRILLSTGAFTRDPIQTDHREIVRHAPALGLPGYELSMYPSWYGHLDEVVSDLRESGLAFPAVHADKTIGVALGGDPDEVDDGLERLELNCRAAAALDSRTLVLHLWERPGGDEKLERNLEHLPACLDTATAYGVQLVVETIPGDVGTPLANVRLALERDSRCRVCLDTEFLGFHGQVAESIAAEWLWTENAVAHVHLKDFSGRLTEGGERRYLLPGEGTLDLQGFLNGLVQRGYAGAITIEATAVQSDGSLDPSRLSQLAAVVVQLASA